MERIIAQRILTDEIISWDVPMSNASLIRELSGPGGLRGIIAPDRAYLRGADGKPLLREWSTALYYESSGQIRGGGIVTRLAENDEGKLEVEAPGFSTYPTGIPYTSIHRPGLGADPLDVLRHLWAHVQSFPDADLGVTVDSLDSGAKLDDTSGSKPKAYELVWWDHTDCGQEIEHMLEAAPADYIERTSWNADHTSVLRHVELGTPRLGKQRHDLRFVEGENVIQPVPNLIDGDDFAQNIIALGRGEGRKMVRVEHATRDDRLRRVAVVADKRATAPKASILAKREHARRAETEGFTAIVVRDHPNARLSAIDPGDDIYVTASPQWFGMTSQWVRVLSIEEPIDSSNVAILTVARASHFAS